MSGMLSKNILSKLWRADFDKITNYILDICELVVEDYENKQLKLPNDENKIRSIMLEEYMKKQKGSYGMSDYRFELEVPENYVGNGQHIGRVDIRILLKSDFEKEDAYYIEDLHSRNGTMVEGKLLEPEEKRRLESGMRLSFAEYTCTFTEKQGNMN